MDKVPLDIEILSHPHRVGHAGPCWRLRLPPSSDALLLGSPLQANAYQSCSGMGDGWQTWQAPQMNLSPSLSRPTHTVWWGRAQTQQLEKNKWDRVEERYFLSLQSFQSFYVLTNSYLVTPLASLPPPLLPNTPLHSGQKVPFFHCLQTKRTVNISQNLTLSVGKSVLYYLWQGRHIVWL